MGNSSKSKSKVILDMLGCCVLMLGVITYLIVGFVSKIWHPTWLIIPIFALLGLMLNLVADCLDNLREQKKTKPEIFCDLITGCLGSIGLIVYLMIGMICRIWHPTWLIVVSVAGLCLVAQIVVTSIIKAVKKTSQTDVK